MQIEISSMHRLNVPSLFSNCTAWWIFQSYESTDINAIRHKLRGDQRKELTTRLMRWTFSDCWLLFLLILLNADFWERLREKLGVRIKTFPIPLHSARECLWFIYGFISFILWLHYNAFRLLQQGWLPWRTQSRALLFFIPPEADDNLFTI